MPSSRSPTLAPRRRSLRTWLPLLALGGFILLLTALAGMSLMIQAEARRTARAAMEQFPGDQTEALTALVESERHSLRERNRAVWALGQLGDPRALPLLERHYTGAECQHDTFLCQYELRKAIASCRGGKNVTAWIWGQLVEP